MCKAFLLFCIKHSTVTNYYGNKMDCLRLLSVLKQTRTGATNRCVGGMEVPVRVCFSTPSTSNNVLAISTGTYPTSFSSVSHVFVVYTDCYKEIRHICIEGG